MSKPKEAHTMALISLAYVSASSRDITEEDIAQILESSRRNNKQDNITGMLLYRSGYFIQALEGEEKKVIALYNKIAEDERHRNVLTVHKQKISERTFSDWSMGFNNLDNIDTSKLDGYTDFLNQPFEENNLNKSGKRAIALLELFKEGSNY